MKSPLLQKNGFWSHLKESRPPWYQNAEANLDPIGVILPIVSAMQAWLNHPAELVETSAQMVRDLTKLSENSWKRMTGMSSEELMKPAVFDRRFIDSTWLDTPVYRNLLEHYLYLSEAFERIIEETPAMDHRERRKAAFWFRKYANALSPTNFFITNPHAQKLAIETNGQSLQDGLELLAEDIRSRRLPLTDLSAYTVGKDLAVTQGAVVFRNELLEVIHYTATTEKQRATPIVLITPWINKFYIVDLTPKQSIVKHLLDDGFDVYVTSWRNPTAQMAGTKMDDYLEQGISVAIDTAIAQSGNPEVHAVGYCIGGAALSMWMAIENVRASKEARPVRVTNWTTFTTLVDYHYPGHIEVFVDASSVDFLTDAVNAAGYLDGKSMSAAFRLLRSNNLIWEVAIQRYLYGQEGKPNEILYWNMDSTRLPAAMYSWYLRELYLNNRLIVPNALSLCDTPIDLGKIVQPVYVVAAEEDHIAPWRSVAHINRLVPAPKRGVLSSSGHILGIINPPRPDSKRTYRVGDVKTSDNMHDWELRSEERVGSWWPDWFTWLHARTGAWVEARPVATTEFPKLCLAPGTYVLEMSDHSSA
jgi:polyhydroxyalkanoate synthase